MELVVLLFVTLLRSCEAQGSSAVTPVFVKKGEDVLLKVTEADGPENVVFVSWNFNKTDVLVTFTPNSSPKVFPDYTGRVEFNDTNYSMKLKNLQKTDSGLYRAQVFRGKQENTQYIVTVQDPVSPVKLSVDSLSNSSDSCNVTVICRTRDSHINSTFRCDTQSCSQDGGQQSKVTTSGTSLQVHLDNDSIICNHSNQVSWTEDRKIIQHFCPRRADPQKYDNSSSIHLVAGVTIVPVVLLIIIILFVWCWRKRKNSKSQNIENTVYEVPQVMTHRHQDPDPTVDASGQSQNSTYCLVGQHTGPAEYAEPRGLNQPESLYAQVDKPKTVKT